MADEQGPSSGSNHFIARLATFLSMILAGIFGARAATRKPEAELQEPEIVEARPPKIWPETRPGWEKSMPDKLPKPTYAPAALALGITLAGAGIVTSGWVSVAGLVLTVLGLKAWIGQLK
jgi:hypothetical protein